MSGKEDGERKGRKEGKKEGRKRGRWTCLSAALGPSLLLIIKNPGILTGHLSYVITLSLQSL